MEFTDNEFQGEKWKMEEMHNRWVTQGVDIDQKVDLISRAGKCVNIIYSGGVCLIRYDKPTQLLVYHSSSLLYLSVGSAGT